MGTLANNTTSGSNTALGAGALFQAARRILLSAISAGRNVATGSYNIEIGNEGGTVPVESRTICVGTQGTQTPHLYRRCSWRRNRQCKRDTIDSAGQLGTASSSREFKKAVKPMNKASGRSWRSSPSRFNTRTTDQVRRNLV